ncbi:protein-disulfide reductase DsbD family protein [Robertkochia solimangrovi]|uniref:protein-disulfide reductase DsbD family protein n=1 Tax=Robertkochia solimangrovi TaxID=2213046 RepID=UPI0011806078|nr:thioredoxin family protein [Robertkochia solimangrovi]TRZ42314.1 thiol:disulfide interchange protein [Robertkochia solimangrovi]
MRKFLLSALLLATSLVSAQILDPVTWKTDVKKLSDTEYELIATATIDMGWHLYSQDVPKGGPNPTLFSFKENDSYELLGKVAEEEGHTVMDPTFEMMIKFFSDKAEFRQKVKVLKDVKVINGEVEFMVCNDTQCLPPKYVDLNFKVNYTAPAAASTTKASEAPVKEEVVVEEAEKAVTEEVIPEETPEVIKATETEKSLDSKPSAIVKHEDTPKSDRSIWTIFILAFLSGFAALLTPCVFPMIPLTVSFFTKQSKTKAAGIRNAILYGLSIITIYVLLGTFVVWIFGPDSLNRLSTNVTFNIIFFLLLVIFAISFMGAFEITLPNSWANKVDQKSNKGGVVGIIFMALALAIVSFSCTGPIVGTLLVEAASKGGYAPVIGMFGFSLALALPFTLFAAFPGWMNSLPKSGGWLNTVKVVLGFLELALAFKFLSNADLVLQLHIFEREIFLAIWIAIFGALAFYLFGKIQLPHDSPVTHISVGRLLLGLLVLTFTIYLIPGLWGAPLKMISGFPPPLNYSESPYGVGYTKTSNLASSEIKEFPEGAHLGPHDIISFHDYEEGLAYAKKVGKPVLIDFTGHACVNCRKMEDNVWSEPEVLDILNNDVVLISLYVDDKRDLPDAPENISKLTGEKYRNIGQKWSEFQQIRYQANAQPYYVIINHNEENLVEPSAYNPDVEEYYNWLQEGVGNFKK